MGSCVGTCLTGRLTTERESLVACGGKVASCRIFMGSYRAVCVCVCVNSASPHPTKLCQRQGGLM